MVTPSTLTFTASAAALALACSQPCQASETIAYKYDPLGRLVQVQRSGSVNAGALESFSYDPADNRTARTVSNAPQVEFSVPIAGGKLLPLLPPGPQ